MYIKLYVMEDNIEYFNDYLIKRESNLISPFYTTTKPNREGTTQNVKYLEVFIKFDDYMWLSDNARENVNG